jgi:hypothetical protein
MRRRDALRLIATGGVLPALQRLAPADLTAFHVHRSAAASTSLRVLGARENAIVVAAAERILPATDTPGAAEAQVNRFVDASGWQNPSLTHMALTARVALCGRRNDAWQPVSDRHSREQ